MNVISDFTLKSDSEGFQAVLVLKAGGQIKEPCDTLCFSSLYPINAESLVGGVLERVEGDWHAIRLDLAYDGSGDVCIEFSGNAAIIKATDYPYGAYLQSAEATYSVDIPRNLDRPLHDGRLQEHRQPAFIPGCQNVNFGEEIVWPGGVSLIGDNWNRDWLQRLFARHSGAPEGLKSSDWQAEAIYDERLKESFQLQLTAQSATVRYRDQAGFNCAQAYLFQYLLQWVEQGTLTSCHLSDTPQFEYRGVHLDVVRHFFAVSDIENWLDLVALFQFNHFHWHLTDDDGWRVASDRYPALTDIGAWRGPGLPMVPQMGSGGQRYGGFYSKAEVRQLVAQAQSVGLSVVPELDIPGHAKALLRALPQLVEADDESEYRSIQNLTDNVINPAYGQTIEVLKELIDEWCELFPGPLFHVGSDEVPKGVWQGSSSAQRWVADNQSTFERLQGHLLAELEAHLNVKGRTMAGWEEVRDGNGVSNATWVYSWQGIEAGQRAAKAGHPVVMTPAQSCYLDLAATTHFYDPGYTWAGTLSMDAILQYDPLAGLNKAESACVKGVQYCLWAELLESAADAEFMMFPRLLAGAQVVWGCNTNAELPALKADIERWSGLLTRLGVVVSAATEEKNNLIKQVVSN